MSSPLAESVVLVTGAAKRLGRAIAQQLAGQDCRVAVHYHRSEAQAQSTVEVLQKQGAQACAFQADLAQESACHALVDRVIAHFGRWDSLVNSASIFLPDRPENLTFESLQAHWQINVAAPLVLAQRLHAHLQARQGRGVVVNLLDQKLWNMNPDFLSYTLSKAALASATTSLAMAFAPCLRVMGIAPGLTLESPWLQGAAFEQAHRQSPLGRSSDPENIAQTVSFILLNPALTGSTILVDGGQHLMRCERDFSVDPQFL